MTSLQVKVLQILSKCKGRMTRAKLYEKLGFKTNAGLNDVLGRNDPEKRKERDQKYPSLLTLEYIDLMELDIDGLIENSYSITPRGRKSLLIHETQELKKQASNEATKQDDLPSLLDYMDDE